MQRFVFLLLFSFVTPENTSDDNIEVGPIVSRFSPGNSLLHTGRQLFKDLTAENVIEKVSDKFYEEYLYDDNVVEIQGREKESIETLPVNPRTTMSIEFATQASVQWTGTIPSVAPVVPTSTGTFATLLVDEVTYTSAPDTSATRPPLRLVHLNDGDVVHRRRIKLRDSDDLPQKATKRPDWRRYWKSIPARKRTLVANDVGGDIGDDIPPPPPGSQLIQIIQNKKQVRADNETPKLVKRRHRPEGCGSQQIKKNNS